MVYVIDENGNPLMPTDRHRKVRLWLNNKQAKVVRRQPFTIQLLFPTGHWVQDLKLGIDPGYSHVGVSALSDKREYFRAEVEPRTNISKLLKERKMYRRGRRQRNTRYRQARFLNRKRPGLLGATDGKRKAIPPSLEHLVLSHQKLVNLIKKILPIKEVRIESNSFDAHKMKNPDVNGVLYQQGEQYGYENTKAYVLARDKRICYFNKRCDDTLHVHHIIFRIHQGSDAPSNLITLCEKHHDLLHAGKVSLGKIEHKSYKEATAMNLVHSQLFKLLPEAKETFGYITKAKRLELKLEKSHSNDAFVIAGGTMQVRAPLTKMAFKRKNNRCLQLNCKGRKPSIRKQRYPLQPKDLVRWNGKVYRVRGTHSYGTRVSLDDGSEKPLSLKIKDVKFVFHEKTLHVTN